ncbi:interferon alpha/beta receptor 1 isoform X1 [Alligator sinensis]|uniref:Interferon alpha/beta receptor 1 isoform X1 n=2 Tax=Alligator sinensis TaxID=38654 RepID=A0A1U7SJ05_ALLSI|nr:interferon alpha/beta receptor 1 isoform X1 [Alligator sinensis]
MAAAGFPCSECALSLAALSFLAALGSGSCAGQMNLMIPQNVQVHIINTNITLKWDWDSWNNFSVTFSAHYQWLEDCKENGTSWTELPGCQSVTVTECDLSSAVTDYLCNYSVRVRAERGEEKSPWSEPFIFIPDIIAEIGPPEVQLESVDGVMKVNISPPEANSKKKMWAQHSFSYNAVIWKKSSNAEPKNRAIYPRDIIDDLEPETAYCMKVQARLISEAKRGYFSPEQCINTTRASNGLPCPTNVTVHALNMKFLLNWDNHYNKNVSFNVQYLSGFYKQFYEDYSNKWYIVAGCENISHTQCDFSSNVGASGNYYIRVNATNGYNRSCSSKEIKVDPCVINEIGPPSVKVNSGPSLLRIQITCPGEENKSMSECYEFTYRIQYWENSSKPEVENEVAQQPFHTISNLMPSRAYCLKVQAFARAYNKSGQFSNVICTETLSDQMSPLVVLTTFLIAVVVVLVVAVVTISGIYLSYKKIIYVFFPSCKPPSNIESFGGQLFSNLYISTSEEPAEKCCIIENTIQEEANPTDFKNYSNSKQSSRDSGNYSNDDDTSGSKVSEETLEQEIV